MVEIVVIGVERCRTVALGGVGAVVLVQPVVVPLRWREVEVVVVVVVGAAGVGVVWGL